MAIDPVQTSRAPAAIGPYSQGILMGRGPLVFVSGQIPLDPETGAMETGDVGAQTHRVMRNLQAILEAAGIGFDRVVKTTIFLKDMGDFHIVNEVYMSYFPENGVYPARATVEVSRLPKDVDVEIDCIASGLD